MKELFLNETHGLFLTTLLHLIPGIIAGIVFYLSAYFLYQKQLPLVFAYHIETIFIIAPLFLLIILWFGKDIISNQNSLSLKEYVLYIGGSLIWAVLIFATIGNHLSNFLLENVFYWIPKWFTEIQLIPDENDYSKGIIRTAWILTLLTTSILAPILEEFYFRGLLLPKLEYLGFWAPVISTVLFAIYHFWSPWLILVRIIAIFPMIYFSWKTGNIYIAIITHLLLNLVGDSLITAPKVWK